MTFAIVSMARTGSTTVGRFLSTDPAILIAYEPKFFSARVRKRSLARRTRHIFTSHSGIKHVWDPNGWPYRNSDYVSTLDSLRGSEQLIDFNAIVADSADRVVFLRRRDQFARTMSDLLGQQLQLWGHTPTQRYTPEERTRYREMVQQAQVEPISSEVVEWYMMHAWKQESSLIDRIPPRRRLIVYYEDLFNEELFARRDFSRWRELASWVGSVPRFDDYCQRLISPHEKYNTESTFARIPNYDELRARFAGVDPTHPISG